MADSAIGWTDKVWNPVIGCTRVSDGCLHCYAEIFASRLEAMGKPQYEGLTKKHRDGSVNWTGVVKCLPERLEDPLHWRKPCRVFVNSMSDLFHEAVPDEFIAQVFAVMARCPQHTFQVLTKRPERMQKFCSREAHWWGNIADIPRRADYGGPLPNVWLGVSVENQAAADERIPLLLQTPAAVRFLSCEPLLGPLERLYLKAELVDVCDGKDAPAWLPAGSSEVAIGCAVFERSGIDWVIVGGESGPHGRWLVERCDVAEDEPRCCLDAPDGEKYCARCPNGWRPTIEGHWWVRSIRNQCQAAGVPLFFKQWGGPTNHAGGRLLDGREWSEFPQEPHR